MPANAGGTPIAFTKAAYPYWHADTNGNGRIDPEEVKSAENKYPAYTPRLLQAVYNYTFALRDGGAAYHNGSLRPAAALQLARQPRRERQGRRQHGW